MSPLWQAGMYLIAIVLFVLAGMGYTGLRRPIALGWFGVALVTLVLLAGAVEAV